MTLPKGWTSRLFTDKPYSSGRYTVAIYGPGKRYVGSYLFAGFAAPAAEQYTANGRPYPNAPLAIAALLEGDTPT